jgi:hypothetical protein
MACSVAQIVTVGGTYKYLNWFSLRIARYTVASESTVPRFLGALAERLDSVPVCTSSP